LGSVIGRGKIRIVCEVVDFYTIIVVVVVVVVVVTVVIVIVVVIVFVFVVEDSGLLGCNTVSLGLCLKFTAMHCLTMVIRSEKCVVGRFHHYVNVIEYTYTNLESVAYYTPRLYGIVYCC
jgi:hypothetical protein